MRDVDAGSNLQTFLVSAVTAVLLVRLYLTLTGYPQIGGGGLHVAHLLWGGLLMLVAQILTLSLLGKRSRHLAAIVGGVGLGLFIDEVGKFVTSNNDYFFEPAIAIIYVVFILLFLTFRAIEHRRLSREEALVNSAEMLTDLILDGATRAELARARWLLRRSRAHGPLVDGLREAISAAVPAEEHRSPISVMALWAWRTYERLLHWALFQRAILVLFVGQALLSAVTIVAVVWVMLSGAGAIDTSPAELVASAASLACALVGMVRLPASRLEAFRWFERSVLISVFFTQVILFLHAQLAALGGLAWNLLLLAVLRFLIHQETARVASRALTQDEADL